MNYFESKAKFVNEDDKKVTEEYLVDAMSFTETETKVTENFGGRDFTITRIAPSKIIEVINPDAEKFFKAVIEFEADGKKMKQQLLFGAKDADRAKEMVDQKLLEVAVNCAPNSA